MGLKPLFYDKVNDRYELGLDESRDRNDYLAIYALDPDDPIQMREAYALEDGVVKFAYLKEASSDEINWRSKQYQKEYNVTDDDLIEATLPRDLFKELWDIVVHYEEV